MFTRLFLISVLALLRTECEAQVTAVVYDIETHMPVPDAKVFINPKGTTTTDRYGRFFIQGNCHSITITHVAFEMRVLARSEVHDTIFVLPKMNVVDDVVIIGHKPKYGIDFTGTARSAAASTPRQSSLSFDFFSIFTKKKKSAKEREKFNKLMRDYSK